MAWFPKLRARIYRGLFPLAKAVFVLFRPKTKGVAVVLENNGRVLLVRNTYGSGGWGFPGGGIKAGEDPAAAGRRELREEAGIVIDSVRPVGMFGFFGHHRRDTVHVFAARTDHEAAEIDEAEIREARWFPRDRMPIDQMTDVGREIWKLFLDRHA